MGNKNDEIVKKEVKKQYTKEFNKFDTKLLGGADNIYSDCQLKLAKKRSKTFDHQQ